MNRNHQDALVILPALVAGVLLGFLLVGCGSNGGSAVVAFTNGQAADVVIGQANFASSGSGISATSYNDVYSSVIVANGKLFIPDYGGHRVMAYNSIPTATSGAPADYAIGQLGLASGATMIDQYTLGGPQSPVVADGHLFVADYDDDRISIYNTVPGSSPGTMDAVLGQPDKTTGQPSSLPTPDYTYNCTASGLYQPETVSVAGGKVVVADGSHNRVLIWSSLPTSDGQAADLVLGQKDMTSCSPDGGGAVVNGVFNYAGGAWTDGTRLVAIDKNNNRVLVWNSFPTVNNQPADLVLGQKNFTGASANQGNSSPDATTLSDPYEGVTVANGQLFIADSGNNRVLVWNSFPAENGQAADMVLGQSDFISSASNRGNASPDATTLSYPTGVFLSGSRLFVTDTFNTRVLIYGGN